MFEVAIVVRSAILLTILLVLAWRELRRKDEARVLVLTGLVVVFGVWLWAESATADYANDAEREVLRAEKARDETRRMAARMLALEIYASYHATATEAEQALTDERLQQIAQEEQMVWVSDGDQPSEPLPLRVRRLRRAIFELMPVWESDLELLEQTSFWFSQNDPVTSVAFQHVLQNGGELLLKLRLNWLRAVAIPAVRSHLVAMHEAQDTTNRLVELRLPASLAIASSIQPTVKLDVATLPHLEEEAARLELQLVDPDSYYMH